MPGVELLERRHINGICRAIHFAGEACHAVIRICDAGFASACKTSQCFPQSFINGQGCACFLMRTINAFNGFKLVKVLHFYNVTAGGMPHMRMRSLEEVAYGMSGSSAGSNGLNHRAGTGNRIAGCKNGADGSLERQRVRLYPS